MTYSAKILADSISPSGVRLTTIELTIPRIVLSEFNTHRMLSRNSASSRAIPTSKVIDAVEREPFIPETFYRNKKGMQSHEPLGDGFAQAARNTWVLSMQHAIESARLLDRLGVHKQLANRILEPYMWHTIIVTATEWENFINLRAHPAAQEQIRIPAEMIRDLLQQSEPKSSHDMMGFHLPLLPDFDDLVEDWHMDKLASDFGLWQALQLISVGRCARVSYLTHDGRRDPNNDITLALRLKEDGHMSPFEHVARVMSVGDAEAIVGRGTGIKPVNVDPAQTFSGNFRGWISVRKTLRNESVYVAKEAP